MHIFNSSDPAWMNIPSDFVIPERRPKRDPGPVNFDVLDASQMKVAEVFMDYIEGRSKKDILVITGWAGCGKTFLTSRIVEWLVFAKKLNTAVTAPTNKAVDVAREMSEIESKLLTFSTLHKLLALKESYDYHGRLIFKPDPHEPPSLDGVEVLFVDETSMLDNALFGYLMPYIKKGLKLIFVGDPAQIPPINHVDAMPFLSKFQRQYNMELLQLTEMHRQALENPILRMATAVRESVNDPIMDYKIQTEIHNDGGIIAINKTEKDIIYGICDAYFANNIFSGYSDFMKVTAWRNITVNAINAKVRQLIYNRTTLPAIMEGEKLLAHEPIKDTNDRVIFTTNGEFEVVDYEVKEIRLHAAIKGKVVISKMMKYYFCKVRGTQPSNKRMFGKDADIWIIHEDSQKDYDNGLEVLKKEVLALDGFDRVQGWQTYYSARNTFAQVKYNYAITTHKAQGSSYESCMMLDWDILCNQKISERNRIRYVAMTRPRKYLFIVHNQ